MKPDGGLSRTEAGFSLVELSVAMLLLATTAMVATSIIWTVLNERRASRQDNSMGDVARQTDAILRSSQKCLRLIRCNLSSAGMSINPDALAPIDLVRGIADFNDSCVASAGTIASAGALALGDPSLRVARIRLARPSLIAHNASAAGTFSTVTYSMETTFEDVVDNASREAGLKRPISSTLSLVVDATGQPISCSSLGRAPTPPSNTFAACGSGDPAVGIGTLNASSSACSSTPQCPNNSLNCSTMSSQLEPGTGLPPAIFFDGMTATTTVSVANSYCRPANVSLNGTLSGTTTVGGINVSGVNTYGGTVRVNAVSVGNVTTQATSEAMIVARSVGTVQTVANSGETCVSAQSITGISGQGGFSVFGRKEGGTRGTLGSVGFGSTASDYHVQGFNLTSAVSGQAGEVTIKDSSTRNLNIDASNLNLDGVQTNGSITVPRTGGSATIRSSSVSGLVRFGNSTTGIVSGSTFSSGLELTNLSTVNLTTSSVSGNVTIFNGATLVVGAGASVENVTMTQTATLRVEAGGRVTGTVNANSSQFTLIRVTGAGSSIQRLRLNGQNGPTEVRNGGQIQVLDGTSQVFRIGSGGSYTITCSGGALVISRAAGSVMPPGFGAITLNSCGIP